MKIIIPSLLLPPISFFIDALKADEWLIEINETFTKQTFRNRYYIATSQGIRAMIVPLYRPNGSNTLTKDILLSKDYNWIKYHHKTIITNYRNSAYFDYYEDELIDIFSKYDKLYEINTALLQWTLNQLNYKIDINYTNDFKNDYSNDYLDLRTKYRRYEAIKIPVYRQVFIDKLDFIPNLSIFDLLCNLGPESIIYLKNLIL